MILLGALWLPLRKIVVPCKVVRAIDGDTVEVEVKLRVNVRLKDVDAPELGEPGGIEAKRWLEGLCVGKEGELVVPVSGNLSRSISLGRVVGDVKVRGKSIAAAMREWLD